jgi:hypothetical protein
MRRVPRASWGQRDGATPLAGAGALAATTPTLPAPSWQVSPTAVGGGAATFPCCPTFGPEVKRQVTVIMPPEVGVALGVGGCFGAGAGDGGGLGTGVGTVVFDGGAAPAGGGPAAFDVAGPAASAATARTVAAIASCPRR